MSRSYKKTLGFCDRNPFMKKIANGKVRRQPLDETPMNGGSYKKLTEKWDICDWKIIYFTDTQFRENMNELWKFCVSRGYEPESSMSYEEYVRSEMIRHKKR
jgi:hypothetical protein